MANKYKAHSASHQIACQFPAYKVHAKRFHGYPKEETRTHCVIAHACKALAMWGRDGYAMFWTCSKQANKDIPQCRSYFFGTEALFCCITGPCVADPACVYGML
eukprot:scaffold264969_cov22-Tisochrysis_lutea.AAC.1